MTNTSGELKVTRLERLQVTLLCVWFEVPQALHLRTQTDPVSEMFSWV
jgi:hypothetical protein